MVVDMVYQSGRDVRVPIVCIYFVLLISIFCLLTILTNLMDSLLTSLHDLCKLIVP